MTEQVKDTLAEVTRVGTWSADQRTALKRIFQKLADVFEGVVLFRGKRVTISTSVTGSVLAPTFADCPFKPKAVHLLSVSDETTNYANFVIAWTWSSTPTGGTVTLVDTYALFGAIPDGSYSFDLLLEKE